MTDDSTFPMRAGAPSGTPGGYNDPADIDKLLKLTAPNHVTAAGRNYKRFASAYEKVTSDMVTVRDLLHEAWGGTDAAVAQSALREIWSSSATLHRTAQEFGSAIENHGSNLAWYKDKKPPSKDLAEARSWMTGANERIYQAWAALPTDVSTVLPPGAPVDGHSSPAGVRKPTGRTSGGGNPAGGPAVDGRTPHVGGHAPKVQSGEPGRSHRLPGNGQLASGLNDSDTQLAGAPPSGLETQMPGGGTGLLPSDSGGARMTGADLGTPGSRVSGVVLPDAAGILSPGSNRWGPDGSRRAVSGAAASAAEEAQTAEARAASQTGVMSPAGGAAGDRRDRERERTTWLTEDEDTWTGGIEAGSHLIGATEARDESAPAGDETAEIVQIDLSSDSDDLDRLLHELSLEDSGEDLQQGLEDPTSSEQERAESVRKDSPWYFEEDQ
ncbi:hypothetical protein NE235_12155 [Actinoallomurus spadix]|uniref:PPE family domain-containing protein n=1 Tax=Actinoallomurus spadix TaxID=79912 RepID=A0ABN0X5U7_9ACTN|nr:hypothetical protein [Actinoallomurus spadix]MCO5986855.1 hypothetical protein [Actinoallomurus spadix]